MAERSVRDPLRAMAKVVFGPPGADPTWPVPVVVPGSSGGSSGSASATP